MANLEEDGRCRRMILLEGVESMESRARTLIDRYLCYVVAELGTTCAYLR